MLVAATGRPLRSVRLAIMRAVQRLVVSESTVSSRGRSGGDCGCGIPRSKSRTGLAWSILTTHTGACPTKRSTRRSTCRAVTADGGANRCAAHRCGAPLPHGPNPGRGSRGKLKDIVSISNRPAEAADPAVPSDLEGALILGRGEKSQIARIVERTTRFTLPVPRPTGRKAHTVRVAIASKIIEFPAHLAAR